MTPVTSLWGSLWGSLRGSLWGSLWGRDPRSRSIQPSARRVARLILTAVAIGGALGALLGPAGVRKACAARRDWTGSAACGGCHPAELAAWQVTAHARTRDRFATRPEPRCLGCHATGEAPAGPAIAVEVGCEACHGAGAAYAEADVMRDPPVARALGLADVSTPKARAAVCAACHRSATRGVGFDSLAPVHPVAPRP